MSVYLLAQISIHDPDRYTQYGNGFMDIFSKYNGKLLSVDEAPETMEGEWPYTRTVLIEFPSRDDARAWYDSEEYQALASHRFAASDANIVMIKGLDLS
ncbi:MAG: DUF1330 domain-containing protein [Pseudomonadales bacterium]|nr:DUF1330 domain-containing protein [Pseudomonadales bacterium]